MGRLTGLVGLVLLVVAVSTPAAFAQETSIAGTVRDGNGGVLPGVTVVAASPVLIEKTRTAVTDGGGVGAVRPWGADPAERTIPVWRTPNVTSRPGPGAGGR